MCMQSTGQFTLFMIRQDIQLSNVCEHFPLFVKSTYSFSQFVQICPQLEFCARIEEELWRRKKNVAFFEWRNECLKCFARVLIEVYFEFSYTQRGIDISAVFWREYLFNPASNRPLTGQSGRRKPSAICWYVHCWTAIKHVDAQKVFFHDVYTRHGAGKRLMQPLSDHKDHMRRTTLSVPGTESVNSLKPRSVPGTDQFPLAQYFVMLMNMNEEK